MTEKKIKTILNPMNQKNLFGYKNYLNSFIKLYETNKFPHALLLSGLKGSGKSTFIYHFINYIMSLNEKFAYSLENMSINEKSSTFNLMKSNSHPNFFLLDSLEPGENIKIEQTRNLLKYLNKTTYYKNIKVVLVDNAEYLNINASNALLKELEEPTENTFFFIVHNDTSKIIDTVKSRCVNYRFHFSINEKISIFKKLNTEYNFEISDDVIRSFLSFDTPGNLLKYLLTFDNLNLTISNNYLSCIDSLIDTIKVKKESELLKILSFFIENFYTELSLKDSKNINNYYMRKDKILYLINDTSKFNLDKKNLIFSLNKILKNERQL